MVKKVWGRIETIEAVPIDIGGRPRIAFETSHLSSIKVEIVGKHGNFYRHRQTSLSPGQVPGPRLRL
jgi:hypothetical protein